MCFTPRPQFTLGAAPFAFSPRSTCAARGQMGGESGEGQRGGQIHGERLSGMKYVLRGRDCPTAANLICTSSLLPGYATMKSISTTPGHQSHGLPSG